MSPASKRHGKLNGELGRFVTRQQRLVAEVIAADLEMFGRRMDELHWREALVEDNVVVRTLGERFAERMTATGLARLETLVMRNLLGDVCGPEMLARYRAVHRAQIVKAIFALHADGLEMTGWERWERRLEDDYALATQVVRKLSPGQLGQLQRQIDLFVDDRAKVAGALRTAVPRAGARKERIEQYRKQAGRALAVLGDDEERAVERDLMAGRYRSVAAVIAPAVV